MNGGEAVLQALEAAGIKQLFGLLGSTTMEVYDALYDAEKVRYIGVRDERAGTHMADAVGRISDRPGVILAGQAGPGATNLVTGLAQAQLAYSPVVAITGLASTEHLGRDTFQEVDQQSIFNAVTKRTFTVAKAERIGELVYEACRLAMAGRRGPVVVQVPRDLFARELTGASSSYPPLVLPARGAPDTATLDSIKARLVNAQRPAIIAGGGVKWSRASQELAEFAERFRIPVTASAGHADVIRSDHPLYFGQVGPRGNPLASQLARQSDLILALGTRLGFNTTFYGYNDLSRDASIVQVDVDPAAIGRYFPVDIGYAGDVGGMIAALTAALSDINPHQVAWWNDHDRLASEREKLWQERSAAGTPSRSPLSAERVFMELRGVLPHDAIITLDAGTLCLQATDQLCYFKPPALITPLYFGLVGFSYAAGLGAKLAAPDRPVVTLMGDGGFAMTMAEITTAVQSGINTVAVVLDNGCWGAEKAYQRDFYNGRFVGADIVSPPYDKVAELCGAAGYSASQPGELADALSKALASGRPSVIHVKVDPDAIVSFRRDSFAHRLNSGPAKVVQ